MHSSARLLSLVLAAGLSIVSGAALAQGLPSTGLGQSWPNATDMSASPRYHVFVFERQGTRYVQVNDLNGNVRGAFAYAGGDIMGLPIGRDAARLSTPTEPLAIPARSVGEVVYRDTGVVVSVVQVPSGAMMLQAASSDCKNPAECAMHVQ